MNALEKLKAELKLFSKYKYQHIYKIPAIWSDINLKGEIQLDNPFSFFYGKIIEIYKLSSKKINLPDKNWSDYSVIYNLFVRYTTAWDHNADGEITNNHNEISLKETGTFLKSIAILPYLYKLGVNTIYLLPITEIGIDGRKGDLGSPYAIKNPFKIDPNLSENFLSMTIEEQFKAFVEACHLLGFKVVIEFVLRTGSKDSDLALEHPDWFYWIKEKIKDRKSGSNDETQYGPPIFTDEEITMIKEKIENNDFVNLPTPHKVYREMFVVPPNKVARVDNKIIGVYSKKYEKTARIPGAFADWPPDDVQPPWTDVTYLRLYSHPAFNYIAYNTVRMYEQRLTRNKYKVKSLWDNIGSIIPYYQENFGIDGVMIDMGHALPEQLRKDIVNIALTKNPNFIFWEENFSLTKKSIKDGYDAVVGYLPFDLHLSHKVQELLEFLSTKGSPIKFFGTAETHNTHRTAQREGGIKFSLFTWALVSMLPTLPFILTGFEIGDDKPINTGLCFEPEELTKYNEANLALFSTSNLNWTSGKNLTKQIKEIINIRKELIDPSNNLNPRTFNKLNTTNDNIIGFTRIFPKKNSIFIGNMSSEKTIFFAINIKGNFKKVISKISDEVIFIKNNWLIYSLKPLDFIIGELI